MEQKGQTRRTPIKDANPNEEPETVNAATEEKEEKETMEMEDKETEELEVEKTEAPAAKNKNKKPLLINGEKQYWSNPISMDGDRITGLVYQEDAAQFFRKVEKPVYKNWMSTTDYEKKAADERREKLRKHIGLNK